MKIAIFFREGGFQAWLLKTLTGEHAYHCGFVDEQNGKLYDMNRLRRRREWPHPTYSLNEGNRRYELFDIPEPGVRGSFLEYQLDRSDSKYGVVDYVLFALRPIYHLFGKSTRNANGIICSEMVNNDIWACGGETPFSSIGEPPSPADLYRWLKDQSRGK